MARKGTNIYEGLTSRGFPQHIAEAFMDSFTSESGLNPTINEVAPLVEGSRGGRGLYQLTGPRRVAYEKQYGTGYDIDSQLDFLVQELQGSERAAANKIFATTTREDAVRSITADFLRPAKDNSDHRIGSWDRLEGSGSVDHLIGGEGADNLRGNAAENGERAAAAAEFALNQVAGNPRDKINAGIAAANKPLQTGAQGPAGGPIPQTGPKLPPSVVQAATSTKGSNVPAAAVAAEAAKTPAPEKQSFGDKIANMLFPNQENPRQALSDSLMMLSTGLGQMSAGNQVDLSRNFAQMAQRRQNIAQAKIAAEQQAFDNDLSLRQIAVQEGTLALNKAKEANAIKQAMSGVPNYAAIGAQYPEMMNLATLAQAGDDDAKRELAGLLAEKTAPQLGSEEEQAALKQFVGASDVGGKLAALEGLTPDAQARVMEMGDALAGKQESTPSAVKLGERLYEENPDRFGGVGDAIEYAAKLSSGIPGGINPEIVKQNISSGVELDKSYRTKSLAAQQSLEAIQLAEDATNELISRNEEPSAVTEATGTIGQIIGSVLGADTAEGFYELTGISPDAANTLNVAEQQMMRALAQAYSGQGTISDSERAQMAREVLSGRMTNQQRKKMINRMKTLARVDQINNRHYRDNVDRTGYANARELDGSIMDMSDSVLEISRAAGNYGTHSYYQHPSMSGKADGERTKEHNSYLARYGDNSDALMTQILPEIPASHAKVYMRALPIMIDDEGVARYTYIDQRTGEVTYLDKAGR